MPAPQVQNKYKEQLENNIYLRTKMSQAFVNACRTLSDNPVGPLDNFTVTIDGILFNFVRDDQIYINDTSYIYLEAKVKTQAYKRLDKFMEIAIEKFNKQFNL